MPMNASAMGQAMYNAVHAIGTGSSETDAKNRMIAMAQEIINHISSDATISPISCTATPIIGTSVHNHAPVTTQSSTGKIS